MRCGRCGKESKDNYFGNCLDCIANHRKIEYITDDIISIGNIYCWIKVKNSDRWVVLNEETFYKLMKESDCSFDLELREDKNYEIYLANSDIKFADKIKEVYGKYIKFAPNGWDFRLPFDMLH